MYLYKYNGKEYQDELGLNVYDYCARLYDPAIGRFMIQDPLADFVNYQSPYVFADNNPILYVDEYGFGIFRAIGNIFLRIGFGIKKLVSGGSCNCSQFQGESLRDAWNQPDFPGLNNFVSDLFSGSGRNSSSSNSSSFGSPTNNIDNKRDPISAIDLPGSSGISSDNSISFNTSTLASNNNNNSEKKRNKIPIIGDVAIKEYSKFIDYGTLSDKIVSNMDEIYGKLIKTLKEYPQLIIEISGISHADLNEKTLLNDKWVINKELSNARAKALVDFFKRRGVNTKQIKYKEVYKSNIPLMTNLKIINTEKQ